MKKYFIILLILISYSSFAQTSKDNRIVILGDARIEVPADQVEFNIELYTSDSASLDNVYEKQKTLETNIVKILRELNIPNKNITYTLMSVNKVYNYESRKMYYAASRNVYFKLDSLALFQKVQDQLIKGGFEGFKSNFTSTKEEQARKDVFEKAVIVAKAKAELLAKASDRKIKRIVKIADTEESDPILHNYIGLGSGEGFGAAPSYAFKNSDSLNEIPQTVKFQATLKVVFELK